MFEYRVAYIYPNGEVEGFKGCGFAQYCAEQDALEQIRRKCHTLNIPFQLDKVRLEKDSFNREQWETICLDWKSNLRY